MDKGAELIFDLSLYPFRLRINIVKEPLQQFE